MANEEPPGLCDLTKHRREASRDREAPCGAEHRRRVHSCYRNHDPVPVGPLSPRLLNGVAFADRLPIAARAMEDEPGDRALGVLDEFHPFPDRALHKGSL
jgi:hypothetical protein